MADPNLGQLAASTFEKVIGSKPEDNKFLSQWLLHYFKENGGFKSVDGGRLIEFSLEYAENTTFRSYSDLETLDTTRIDVFDAARFEWKENGGTIVFSNIEKKRCSGESAKFELVASKVNNGKMSAMASLNRQFYGDGTGNGGKDVGGLALLVSDTPTTGIVGGINRGTFSFWRSNQTSGANSGTAFNELRGAMRTIYNLSSRGAFAEHPTCFTSDRVSFQGYESTLTVNERFTSKAEGDGGFKNEVLKFKGAKIAFDEDCPAAHMYALNTQHIKFVYPTGGWMEKFKPVEPGNQTAEIVRIATVGNMAVNQSRRLGVITAIS